MGETKESLSIKKIVINLWRVPFAKQSESDQVANKSGKNFSHAHLPKSARQQAKIGSRFNYHGSQVD